MDLILPASTETGIYVPGQYSKVTLLSDLLKRINHSHLGRELLVQATKVLLPFL